MVFEGEAYQKALKAYSRFHFSLRRFWEVVQALPKKPKAFLERPLTYNELKTWISYFESIVLFEMHNEHPRSFKVKSDIYLIVINKDLPELNQVFCLAHEFSHCFLGHLDDPLKALYDTWPGARRSMELAADLFGCLCAFGNDKLIPDKRPSSKINPEDWGNILAQSVSPKRAKKILKNPGLLDDLINGSHLPWEIAKEKYRVLLDKVIYERMP